MKVLGVDASSSCTGTVLLNNGKLVESSVWKPIDKKALPSDRLFEYYQWIGNKLYQHRPDVVAVSSTSFSRSHQTTRVLSRYEAATILAARLYSCDVIELKDSEARSMVLSRGNLSKLEAYNEVVKITPEFVWLPFDKGGNDQTDAFTLAEAAVIVGNERLS